MNKPNVEPPKSSDLSGVTAASLGVRKIAFKLKAHDPRKSGFAKANSYWSNSALGFKYDQKKHLEETFQHRLGATPTVAAICSLLPTLLEVPKSAAVTQRPHVSYYSRSAKPVPIFDDLDSIEIENRTDAQLFEALQAVDGFVTKVRQRESGGDVGWFSDDIYSTADTVLSCDWQDRRPALCVNPRRVKGRQ